MDKLSEIKKKLREVVGANPNLPVSATVKSVEGDHCTITLKSGLELTDVKLKATIDGDNYLLVIPKVGSKVVVLSLSGELDNLSVIKVDEVERIEVIIEDTNFKIDNQGYEINQGGENLKTVFNDYITQFGKLCDELNKVVVSIGVTPNVPVITQIKTEVTQSIKQRLNTILK